MGDPRRTKGLWRSLRKSRWTADDGRRVVGAWQGSGEGATRFARRHGLNPQRLYWWKDRLSEWESTKEAGGGSLVPVVSREAAVAAVRLRLLDGGTVEIDSEAVSAAWVASLIRELASSSEA